MRSTTTIKAAGKKSGEYLLARLSQPQPMHVDTAVSGAFNSISSGDRRW
jgi:hypothetical protein